MVLKGSELLSAGMSNVNTLVKRHVDLRILLKELGCGKKRPCFSPVFPINLLWGLGKLFKLLFPRVVIWNRKIFSLCLCMTFTMLTFKICSITHTE
jgi:hypothetical protein